MTTFPTILDYYASPNQREAEAAVLHFQPKGQKHRLVLDGSIYFPGGGGQLHDVGEIIGENGGRLRVERVQFDNGSIVHEGLLEAGSFEHLEPVRIRLDWNRRYQGMRLHTAGHLLHDAFLTLRPTGLVPRKAEHNRDPYVEYHGSLDARDQKPLEESIDALVWADLPVVMREATFDELVAGCRFLPTNLPKNKPLRTVRIGNGELVPCGGVHVARTGEIGRVVVTAIHQTADQTGSRVHYQIVDR
ncbi:MAG: alanine--tRNA ligase-related protein [Chthoniobacter sp.]|uniref:alanine--tRNA ligase-related protein n=1 Tax=Chthoniobacter sp. TaxID=2510640 RepID=UPI0032A960FB